MQKLQKMEKIWNKNIGSYVPRMIAGIKEVLHEHKTQNKTRLKIIVYFVYFLTKQHQANAKIEH